LAHHIEEKTRLERPKTSKEIKEKKRYENRIFCDDSIRLLKSMPDGLFDACITDPPYNIAKGKKGLSWAFSSHVTMQSEWDRFGDDDYAGFTKSWLKEVCRVTKVNGNILIFGSYHNIYTIGSIAQSLDLRIVNSIIWAKPNAQPNITCRMLTESTEQIIWLCNNSTKKARAWHFDYEKAKALNNGRQMRNFWTFPLTPPRERSCGRHPSQKPLALMERLILISTAPKDLVLDCFSGAGTTLLACKMHKRSYVGIDSQQEYCRIAKDRLA
jgi:site-specific DNA-methyltransferase (adenine-specific)